jgi:carbamoyl-phosphate synthase large subunit
MDKLRIAVSGAGGGVGQSVIKSLYQSGYDIVGLDGEVLAPGLYAVPQSFIIPYANSPEYIPVVTEICRREKIALLFPGLDAELKPLSLNRKAFEEIGTTAVVSEPGVIDISDDKLLTYQKLTAFGIHVPVTEELDGFSPEESLFPLIIKQKVGGARSKNVFVVKTRQQYEQIIEKPGLLKKDYIVQQYIEGDEYTCGSVNLEGECKGVIVMRRILRDGDTHKCFSVKNTLIEETVRRITNTIKPFGACNIQLRLQNGIPYVFEINARCSGTTAARTLSGFNEPKMIADFLLKGIQPSYEIKEQTILRYWQELVVDNNTVETLNNKKTIVNANYGHL